MNGLKLAAFEADLTPPPGEALAYGINRRADSRIYARGVLLDGGRTRVVLAAAEIIGLYGDVYDVWRRAIAAAAKCPAKNVLLHCVHQHDSLIPPSRYRFRRAPECPKSPQLSPSFTRELVARVASAVRKAARGPWTRIAKLATAEGRAAGLASNRRLVGRDGKLFAMRWSMTSNPNLQREPVGLIDPLVRTVAFLDTRGRVAAALHYYATHPMGAYGREMASADIPGVALAHARQACPGAAQIYFTGCAGDITFGKHTFASKTKNLRVLGARLGAALAKNLSALREVPLGSLKVSRAAFDLPLDRARISRAKMEKRLRAAETSGAAHFPLHMLEMLEDWKRWRRVELARLDLGPGTHVLAFPAETVVAYQLFAQACAPEHFVAIAGYAQGLWGYLPTAQMFAEGGYEPQAGPSTPDLEPRYKAAIADLLKDLG
ncbi:MAG: hypothetical protein KIS92_24700 [Planctomycetota bacterium]|nr:hypothetical protein [Planctomycetota bacterium]